MKEVVRNTKRKSQRKNGLKIIAVAVLVLFGVITYGSVQLQAEKRAEERKIEKAKAKIKELEEELEKLEEELFGSAASDYVRAAEIDTRKSEIEEELLNLYEIVM